MHTPRHTHTHTHRPMQTHSKTSTDTHRRHAQSLGGGWPVYGGSGHPRSLQKPLLQPPPPSPLWGPGPPAKAAVEQQRNRRQRERNSGCRKGQAGTAAVQRVALWRHPVGTGGTAAPAAQHLCGSLGPVVSIGVSFVSLCVCVSLFLCVSLSVSLLCALLPLFPSVCLFLSLYSSVSFVSLHLFVSLSLPLFPPLLHL